MAKKQLAKQKRYQIRITQLIKEGKVNTPDGTWRNATNRESPVSTDYLQT